MITPTSITAYLDDTKIGTVASTRTVADFGSDLVAYIGKSSYPDRLWKGGVRDGDGFIKPEAVLPQPEKPKPTPQRRQSQYLQGS